jgi:UDP-N-acetylglucosamine 2-epimerase
LTGLTSALLSGLEPVLSASRPDRVLVHGDTTTTLAAALASYYRKIPVAHVEAGLRSHDPLQPWPEEINRRLADSIADLLFAPTARAKANLVAENVDPRRVFVTGNTIVDALRVTVAEIESRRDLRDSLDRRFAFLDPSLPLIVVTGHRRENFGPPLQSVCEAIARLAREHPVQIVYAMHRNPNVEDAVRALLGDVPNVHVIEPLAYLPFVYLMQRSHLILTDSGGIQEEGPCLGKPVFVARNVTERPEALEAGTVRLVGTDPARIFESIAEVLEDPAKYSAMARPHSPYGDGLAAKRIAGVLAGRAVDEWEGGAAS